MAVSHSGLKTAPSATPDTKSVPLSRSTCLRERGNTLYREATSNTSVPSMCSTRLQEAIQLYCQALSLSQSESDRAKCCKNLGQAFWSLSKLSLVSVGSLTSKQSESLCFNLLSSISYFLEALNHSRPQVQTREWVQGIHWTLVDIVWTVESLHLPRLLSEICSVFQQKVPSNMKLQASAIAHKACAELGYKNAMPLSAPRRIPVLHDCLFQLSVSRSHTDTSATGFLNEINRLHKSITEEISHCQRIKAPNGSRVLKRNQSFSEERSQSTMDRRIPEQNGGRSISFRNQIESQPSDLEDMFSSLSPLDFLTQLYSKYPPPKKESISRIRNLSELRTAYRRAISHYHPDHYKGDSKLPDEITKYLIMNFNGLRSE